MIIEITEDRTRWRTTDYTWHVTLDGVSVAVAKTPGAGDLVAQEVAARNDIALLNGAIKALEQVDQAITAEIEALDSPRCSCGSPALFFVQYPDRTYSYCHDCYREMNEGQPLQAQCARVIRAVLGNVPAGGGIIDELRRVEQALRSAGW